MATEPISNAGAGSFWAQLQKASYRGIPFGVTGGDVRFGRRNAVHEYPFRDLPWVEDLGRSRRMIHLTGFLVGDDVIAQRDRLIAKCEEPGDGELVHPTLGRRKVALLDVAARETREQGRVFEVNFVFVEQGQRLFPLASTATGDATKDAADVLDEKAASTFARKISTLKERPERRGLEAVGRSAQIWVNSGIDAVKDATFLLRMLGSMPGEYGRMVGMASGRFGLVMSQVQSGLDVLANPTKTIKDLIAQASSARVAAEQAAHTVTEAAQQVSPSNAGAFLAAVRSMSATLLDVSPTGTAALDIFASVAEIKPQVEVPGQPSTAQAMTMDLLRITSVAGLARAIATFDPSTAESAQTVKSWVLGYIDAEITTAGDQGDDDVYNALRAMRPKVTSLLDAKSAGLPSLITVTTAKPLPSLVLAQRLYRDPDRADELVRAANPRHPAFMPTEFKARKS